MKRWIEKQRYIIDFTLSSLMRRKGKNLGLLVLYTLIVFFLSSVMFFTHAIKREASIILQAAPEIVVQRVVAGRHDLFPVRYLDELKEIRGASEVHGRLWGYYYDPAVGANYTLMVPPDAAPVPGTIMIGHGLSKGRKAFTGDKISLRAYDGVPLSLAITGIISAQSELISADLMLISEQDYRRLFGIAADYITDATLKVKNPQEIVTVATKIARLLPDTRPIVRDEILRTYDSIFNWRGGMMIVILSFAVLAFVIFAWDKASGLSAGERREIGVLKAIGWETSDVLLMRFWEGAMVSLTAFLLGTLTAYVHVFFTGSAVFEPALKGWSVLYPEFRLVPFISAEQLATLFFLTVVPYSVATIIPSWRAATVDPDAAMRHSGE